MAPTRPRRRWRAPERSAQPVGADENWLVHNIVCQCHTCRHNLMECESEGCGHATQDRMAIRQLLNQGRTRQQIVEYFIQKYGGQVALAAPLNRGFNRLAWLFPYSVAALAAGGLGYGAYRMAKRPAAHGDHHRTFHLRPGSCR